LRAYALLSFPFLAIGRAGSRGSLSQRMAVRVERPLYPEAKRGKSKAQHHAVSAALLQIDSRNDSE